MYLTVDIGATKTLIALFSAQGRVVRRVKFPTAQGAKTFFDTLGANLQLFWKYRIRSVVVAVPGIVQKNGSVRFGNRNWGDVDMLGWLKKLFNCPIYLENDANLAAIYEAYGRPGRTVFLTFSTGIGGGVVDDGKLRTEEFEPGHRVYSFRGETAEWEDLAAASAFERIYHVDRATELRGRKVMKEVAARIYLGLPEIAAGLRPNTIVIGGPMGKVFRTIERYLPRIPGVKYVGPKRPRESVIYGAYLFALEHEKEARAYPEDLLRGMPAGQVMLRRAWRQGRKLGRQGLRIGYRAAKQGWKLGCEAVEQGRKIAEEWAQKGRQR